MRRPRSPLLPYTTLFRSEIVVQPLVQLPGRHLGKRARRLEDPEYGGVDLVGMGFTQAEHRADVLVGEDRKSTRLNSSHLVISYAVFCLKKKRNRSNSNTT